MAPAACSASILGVPLPPLLLLLQALALLAGSANCQMLQGHGQETEMRLCNSTVNVAGSCVAPNHPLLVATIAFFSLLLLAMVGSMALPLSVQNRLLRLLCVCRRKRVFSYVDVGLYKTRHSMYRKEVYVRHVWGNRNRKRSSTAARLSLAAGRLEGGGARRQSRPLAAAADQGVSAAASSCHWEALGGINAGPLATCGSAFCFRSDPNICTSVFPALTVTPASPSTCVTACEGGGIVAIGTGGGGDP